MNRNACRIAAALALWVIAAHVCRADPLRRQRFKLGDVITVSMDLREEPSGYHIRTMVTDVRPNGVLVLEAHKLWIVDNKGSWEYTLTGKVDPRTVSPDSSVLSEDVADLSITKLQLDQPTDSTKPDWFVHLYDWIELL
jgi:hypothetical protein